MSATTEFRLRMRVHLTNVTARGPAQVVGSLLPSLEACSGVQVDEIYLPDRGELAGYSRVTTGPPPLRYRRYLPTILSRALECTLLSGHFDGATPILVLGDIPLACHGPQVVFVQTAQLAGNVDSFNWILSVKHKVARQLLKRNATRVSAFVVQTELMKQLLERTCPGARGKVVVIPQPPPSWLLNSGLKRTGRLKPEAAGLDLLYPAARYVHKNHSLLAQIAPAEARTWPMGRLTLTIPEALNPNPDVAWIDCVGMLSADQMLRAYEKTDGVVFLSKAESYGLPLIEAMHIGLPIIAPDLPYARFLCGSQAIYFQADRIATLHEAITELQRRLARGWWPDWTEPRVAIPKSWSSVADAFIKTLELAG